MKHPCGVCSVQDGNLSSCSPFNQKNVQLPRLQAALRDRCEVTRSFSQLLRQLVYFGINHGEYHLIYIKKVVLYYTIHWKMNIMGGEGERDVELLNPAGLRVNWTPDMLGYSERFLL